MHGHHKYSDGFSDTSSVGSFMDETDREVSNLTDRAFRSLCIGEEAIYNDSEISSPTGRHKAFAEEVQQKEVVKTTCQETFSYGIQYREAERKSEVTSTFQHSHMDVAQEQVLRDERMSYMSNGSMEATWQQRRSTSRVSSLIKAFSSSEGYCDSGISDAVLLRDKYRDFNNGSWDKSALLSFQRELSEISSAYHQNFKSGPFQSYRNNFHASASVVSRMDTTASLVKSSKTKFHALNSTNFFFHSEFSPFQLWKDYNRFPFEREEPSGFVSASEFPRWYDSPLYKELTTTQTFSSEGRRFNRRKIEDVLPTQRSRSTVIQKASAIEKRCESEMASNCPPWKRNNNFVRSKLPRNRPSTVSPTNEKAHRPDSSLLSYNRHTYDIQHKEEKVGGNGLSGSSTPFSITQLLTPVIHGRQETETSEILQFAHTPSVPDYSVQGDVDLKPLAEVKQVRDSYKSRASSLLFNLKDNRRRVKSTYSPSKFKGLEITDQNKQPSKLEDLESRLSDSSASQVTTQEHSVVPDSWELDVAQQTYDVHLSQTVEHKEYTDGLHDMTLADQNAAANYEISYEGSEGSSLHPYKPQNKVNEEYEFSPHMLPAQNKSIENSEGHIYGPNGTLNPTRPGTENAFSKAHPLERSLTAQMSEKQTFGRREDMGHHDFKERQNFVTKSNFGYTKNQVTEERLSWENSGHINITSKEMFNNDGIKVSLPFKGEIATLIEMDKQRKATAKQYLPSTNDSYTTGKETYINKVNENIKQVQPSKVKVDNLAASTVTTHLECTDLAETTILPVVNSHQSQSNPEKETPIKEVYEKKLGPSSSQMNSPSDWTRLKAEALPVESTMESADTKAGLPTKYKAYSAKDREHDKSDDIVSDDTSSSANIKLPKTPEAKEKENLELCAKQNIMVQVDNTSKTNENSAVQQLQHADAPKVKTFESAYRNKGNQTPSNSNKEEKMKPISPEVNEQSLLKELNQKKEENIHSEKDEALELSQSTQEISSTNYQTNSPEVKTDAVTASNDEKIQQDGDGPPGSEIQTQNEKDRHERKEIASEEMKQSDKSIVNKNDSSPTGAENEMSPEKPHTINVTVNNKDKQTNNQTVQDKSSDIINPVPESQAIHIPSNEDNASADEPVIYSIRVSSKSDAVSEDEPVIYTICVSSISGNSLTDVPVCQERSSFAQKQVLTEGAEKEETSGSKNEETKTEETNCLESKANDDKKSKGLFDTDKAEKETMYHPGKGFLPETKGSLYDEQSSVGFSHHDAAFKKKESTSHKSEVTQRDKKTARPEISALADYARLRVISAEDDSTSEKDLLEKIDTYHKYNLSALAPQRGVQGNLPMSIGGTEPKTELTIKKNYDSQTTKSFQAHEKDRPVFQRSKITEGILEGHDQHIPRDETVAHPKLSSLAKRSDDRVFAVKETESTKEKRLTNQIQSDTKTSLTERIHEIHQKPNPQVQGKNTQVQGKNVDSAMLRQPVHAKRLGKDVYPHVKNQESLPQVTMGSILNKANKQEDNQNIVQPEINEGEKVEELEYYTVSITKSEPKPREIQETIPFSDRITSKKEVTEIPTAWPRSNSCSPAMGKPTMFKVKDNTIRTSSVSRADKPRFHRSFSEEFRIGSPKEIWRNSEKCELEHGHEHNPKESANPPVLHEPAVASHRLPRAREVQPQNSLSSEFTAAKEPRSYQRRSQVFEDDETLSVVSTMSEDVESFAGSFVGTKENTSHVFERKSNRDTYVRPESACYERPESVCYERPESACSDMRSLGKPPAVPPKSERALRRAKKLTTRRIQKAEAKLTSESQGQLETKSLRAVSSLPSSPMELLSTHHTVHPSPPISHYHVEPNYAPPAPGLMAHPFPMTQRKLLQDPNSGQYFMVDMPVPVKTKTFFDPETGKYVQLNVRQRSQGTLSQPQPVLNHSYVVYPGFLPMSVSSLPSMRSSSQMSAPATVVEDQNKLEASRDPWRSETYQPNHHKNTQEYNEAVHGTHENSGRESLYTDSNVNIASRHTDIITMSELEDFAMEST
ncbi:hypothetical protein MHYP_G00038220 [Metynnis hypsauchen]